MCVNRGELTLVWAWNSQQWIHSIERKRSKQVVEVHLYRSKDYSKRKKKSIRVYSIHKLTVHCTTTITSGAKNFPCTAVTKVLNSSVPLYLLVKYYGWQGCTVSCNVINSMLKNALEIQTWTCMSLHHKRNHTRQCHSAITASRQHASAWLKGTCDTCDTCDTLTPEVLRRRCIHYAWILTDQSTRVLV